MEGAYMQAQSTKPQSLAYLLSDSPAGMAAWIGEKYRAWSDPSLFRMEDLCDSLTLYWLTNTACTSIRAYYANSFTLPPMGRISTPTAITAFPCDVLPAPEQWIRKNYPVIMYEPMARGGHFTALEDPRAFADSVSRFMRMVFWRRTPERPRPASKKAARESAPNSLAKKTRSLSDFSGTRAR